MFFKRFGKLHLHGIVQTKPTQQINKGNLFLSRESNISMISQVCSLDVKEKVKSTNNCFNPPNLNNKWCANHKSHSHSTKDCFLENNKL